VSRVGLQAVAILWAYIGAALVGAYFFGAWVLIGMYALAVLLGLSSIIYIVLSEDD